MKVTAITVFWAIVFYSCKENREMSPEYYAKQYCACFDRYFSTYALNGTHRICDSIMWKKSKYFEVYQKRFLDDNYRMEMSDKMVDSVNNFMTVFESYLDNNCRSYFTSHDSRSFVDSRPTINSVLFGGR